MKTIEISEKAYNFLERLRKDTGNRPHSKEIDEIITLACIADSDLKRYKDNQSPETK